jgi:hypothetical protein
MCEVVRVLFLFEFVDVPLHLNLLSGGCRHSAYTCICACGPNSAILHYGHAGECSLLPLLACCIPLPKQTANSACA